MLRWVLGVCGGGFLGLFWVTRRLVVWDWHLGRSGDYGNYLFGCSGVPLYFVRLGGLI